ncbi:class I adenylate-forming enzyme family protein [Paenibacillus illinoisensis]|uniref:class I adenylate-forming enzyme family protein n=1 Tax=Paenibacillus illinoisensis TaxID=59845 RepID=UPI001C8D2BD2|nr:fatty acid--CoA ligase family protein [Paenibacillus illinoisensis]MBY0216041.1 long-chain fatty acid--CoA ligase [Paenibacillus illinoisensis]
MSIQFLLERFAEQGARPAFIWEDREYSYAWLLDQIVMMDEWIAAEGLRGQLVTLEEDYSPYAAAAFIALLGKGCIVLPMDLHLVEAKRQEYIQLAQVQWRLGIQNGRLSIRDKSNASSRPALLAALEQEGVGGLVLFSSGSTGVSKATVHRADRLLQRFRRQVRPLRTIPFMMFDHIGGVNTMLQSLASGGCLCIIADRSPEEVCRTIEKHRVQALPVSPTFMNLLLLGRNDEAYDLSSLEVVSYGSEVMSETVLAAWHRRFPGMRTIQAYGMSELGILPTRSKEPGSLLFAIHDDHVQFRVVEGELQIRTETAMIGYLNAPSPFTDDGWLRTGDEAVLEQGYIRILGRRSEIINVGGRKVYPAEVESILEQMDCIQAAVVTGEPSGITGQKVKAIVKLATDCTLAELRRLIWSYCQDKLPPYKIPQKIVITQEGLVSSRMKKVRTPAAAASPMDEVAAAREEASAALESESS